MLHTTRTLEYLSLLAQAGVQSRRVQKGLACQIEARG
jgi:hypothetical protein